MIEALAIIGWLVAFVFAFLWWVAVDRVHWAESKAETLEALIARVGRNGGSADR